MSASHFDKQWFNLNEKLARDFLCSLSKHRIECLTYHKRSKTSFDDAQIADKTMVVKIDRWQCSVTYGEKSHNFFVIDK